MKKTTEKMARPISEKKKNLFLTCIGLIYWSSFSEIYKNWSFNKQQQQSVSSVTLRTALLVGVKQQNKKKKRNQNRHLQSN